MHKVRISGLTECSHPFLTRPEAASDAVAAKRADYSRKMGLLIDAREEGAVQNEAKILLTENCHVIKCRDLRIGRPL